MTDPHSHQEEARRRREVIDQLAQLEPDDVRTIIDLAQMYRVGKRAAVKAVVTAIVGALVTAVGYGVLHWLRTAVLAAAVTVAITTWRWRA